MFRKINIISTLVLTIALVCASNPALARFLSVDPVSAKQHIEKGNVQGFNRYSYANNNPYKYVDPDGREVVYQFNRYAPSVTVDVLKAAVTRAANESPTASAQYAQLQASSNVFVITGATRKVGSHVVPSDAGKATIRQDGSANEGSGGTVRLCLCGENVSIVGGDDSIPETEQIGHEFDHATNIDAGTLETNERSGPYNNPKREDQAIKTENKVRKELNLEGHRERH